MKRYAVIIDSSTTVPKEIENHPDLYMTHLAFTIDGKEFKDGLDLTYEEFLKALKADKDMTSSMPTFGEVMRVYNEVKEQDYDHIFVISISSKLSGTYNAFYMVQEELKIANLTVIDSFTVAGPLGIMAQAVFELAKLDAEVDEVVSTLNYLIDNTLSFIIPLNLNRLMKSGRVNKAVGTLSNLLRLKVILVLENKAAAIDKFDVTRTQKRAFSKVSEALKNFGVNAKEYVLIISGVDQSSPVMEAITSLKQSFGPIKIHQQVLPSILALHGGLGAITIQAIRTSY